MATTVRSSETRHEDLPHPLITGFATAPGALGSCTEALVDGKDSALARPLLLDRWASALSKFKKVHYKDSSQDNFERVSQAFTKNRDFANWIKRECEHTVAEHFELSRCTDQEVIMVAPYGDQFVKNCLPTNRQIGSVA